MGCIIDSKSWSPQLMSTLTEAKEIGMDVTVMTAEEIRQSRDNLTRILENPNDMSRPIGIDVDWFHRLQDDLIGSTIARVEIVEPRTGVAVLQITTTDGKGFNQTIGMSRAAHAVAALWESRRGASRTFYSSAPRLPFSIFIPEGQTLDPRLGKF